MKHDGVSLKKNLASPCGFFYLLRSWQLFIIYKLKIIPFPDDCWQTRVGGDEFLKNFHPSLLFVEEVTKMPLFLSYEVLKVGFFPNRFLSIKSFNNGNSFLSDFKPMVQGRFQATNCRQLSVKAIRLWGSGDSLPRDHSFLSCLWPRVRLELELTLGLRWYRIDWS